MKAAEMAIMQVGRSSKQMLRREGGRGSSSIGKETYLGKAHFLTFLFYWPKDQVSTLHISNFQNKCFREAPYCAIACSAPSSCWGWRALGWTWCGTFAPLLLTVGREEEENGQKWNNDKCEGNLTRGRCTKCAIVLNFFFGLPNMITLEYLQEQLEKTDEDSN